jgi:hypothetical protein
VNQLLDAARQPRNQLPISRPISVSRGRLVNTLRGIVISSETSDLTNKDKVDCEVLRPRLRSQNDNPIHEMT